VLASGIVISEFMASNSASFPDSDGRFTDWIELHNTTGATVNIGGYFLTDNEGDLDKWQFPSVSIAPDGYLVVRASGLDRRDPAGELHTNFKLESAGEYLALVAPDRTTIEADYAPQYPTSHTDVSYGVGPGSRKSSLVPIGATGKFLTPTSATLAGDWRSTCFDDSGWSNVSTGIGFQTDSLPR